MKTILQITLPIIGILLVVSALCFCASRMDSTGMSGTSSKEPTWMSETSSKEPTWMSEKPSKEQINRAISEQEYDLAFEINEKYHDLHHECLVYDSEILQKCIANIINTSEGVSAYKKIMYLVTSYTHNQLNCWNNSNGPFEYVKYAIDLADIVDDVELVNLLKKYVYNNIYINLTNNLDSTYCYWFEFNALIEYVPDENKESVKREIKNRRR